MKKTTYKKEYINGKDVKVNDVLLDTNYPFQDFGDLRMTVIDKPIFDVNKMFEIVYKDAAKDDPSDDYRNEYINGLECIIRVKPYDVSKYETDENGTYYKAFEKPLCRIVKIN